MAVDSKQTKKDFNDLNGLLSVDFKYKNINKKFLREEILKDLVNTYDYILFNINRANEMYKRLYNMTELFERKSCLDFEYNEWQTLKKTKGRLMRYYNELLLTKWRLKHEQNKMVIMGNKSN